MNGLVRVGAVLLEAGAKVTQSPSFLVMFVQPDATNKIGQTALIYACIEKHVAMIR